MNEEMKIENYEGKTNDLYRMTFYDLLTGVKNRNAYNQYMENWKRQGSLNIGVVFADVNSLKYVNDNFGHRAGDARIRKAADIMKQCFPNDKIYRISGDEFVIFYSAKERAEFNECTKMLSEKLKAEEDECFSFGCSFAYACSELDEVMDLAEREMYLAKLEYHKKNPDVISRKSEHDRREAKRLIDAFTDRYVLVLEEENRKVLYFNEKMKQIAPNLEVGIHCYQGVGVTCDNCKIGEMGDKQYYRTTLYSHLLKCDIQLTLYRYETESGQKAIMETLQSLSQISEHVESGIQQALEETATMSLDKYYKIDLIDETYSVTRFAEIEEEGDGTGALLGKEGDYVSLYEVLLAYIHPNFYEEYERYSKLEYLKDHFRNSREPIDFKIRMRDRNGNYYWVEVNFSLSEHDTQQHRTVLMMFRLVDQKQAKRLDAEEQEMVEAALIQGERKIVAKQQFKRLGHGVMKKMRRPVVISINMRNFKYFNISYGELEGDRLVRKLGQYFVEECEQCRMATYTYVDHLLILMDFNESSDSEIKDIVYRMADQFTRELANQYKMVQVHLGCGIYVVKDKDESFYTIQDNARFARRSIKEDYRTAVAMYDGSMREKVVEEASVIPSFEWALENEQIELYLQPKFHIDTQTYAGAELLTRMRTPEEEVMSPDVYIPVLEKSGLIAKLDRFAIFRMIERMQYWHQMGKEVKTVSLNLSKIDLLDEDFIYRVDKKIEKTGLDKRLFEFEVTETAVCSDLGLVAKRLEWLNNKGYRISMDDFGSGYNSLYMLGELPLDIVKFDRGFVLHSINGEKGKQVLSGLIKIFQKMGLDVLCEGIETKEDEAAIYECGCNLVQGFFYEKPLPIEVFEERYIFNKGESGNE